MPTDIAKETTGIRVPVSRVHLDEHAREMYRMAEIRGHESWMIRHVQADGQRTHILGLRVDGAVFSYRRGWLRRIDPRYPLSRGVHINTTAFAVVDSKQATKDFLAARGFPVPAGRMFSRWDIEEAVRFAEALGWPICVKPDHGRKGNFVVPGIDNRRALVTAFLAAGQYYPEVAIERSLSGEVVRFFYVEPRVVGVKVSMPPNVIGDGVRDLAALIELKNEERAVRRVPGHKPIVVDADLTEHLALSGRDLSFVPSPGERVLLRAVSNGAVGADTIACAEQIHPSYAELVERICRSLHPMRIAALDTIVADRTQPFAEGNFHVLEVNNSPGLLPYIYPWEGEAQDICVPIFDMLERLAKEPFDFSAG